MAISVVQRKNKTSGGTNVASISLASGDGWATPTTNNIIVVWGNADATITISGSGWTAGPSVVDGNGAYVWYKVSNGTESTLTLTPGVSDRIDISAYEISGATLTGVTTNSSTIVSVVGTTTTAAAVTTSVGAIVLVAALLHQFLGNAAAPSSPSWSNGFTNQLATNTNGISDLDTQTFVGDLIVGSGGSYSSACTWTNNAGDRQHIIVAIPAVATALPYLVMAPPRR